MSEIPALARLRFARLRLEGQSETERFASVCAALSGAGTVFLLSGGLGAGKSTFARAFVRALTDPDEEVPSPTFTLVQQYGPIEKDGREIEIWHADLYRLGDPDEVLELGLDEAFEEGICLVEWPDRLGSFVPKDAIALELSHLPGEESVGDLRQAVLHLPAGLGRNYAEAFAAAGLEAEWTER